VPKVPPRLDARALVAAFLLTVVTATLPNCNCGSSAPCTTESCSGCCDDTGLCHAGDEASACGLGGSACRTCATSCQPDGVCSGGSNTSDGGGGDSGVPTDGGTEADAGSDAGTTDAGMNDAGMNDAGTTDAGSTDAGSTDAGVDAGFDAGIPTCVDGGPGEVYVASDGGFDTNPGTATLPFKTIKKAIAVGGAGCTVWLHDGTYDNASEALGGQPLPVLLDGMNLRAVNDGAAQVKLRLRLGGSALVTGIGFDQLAGGSTDSIVATNGTVTLRQLTFANTGSCGSNTWGLNLSGTAAVTLDPGDVATHDYAGANVFGLALLTNDAGLTINGGQILGGKASVCSGSGVLVAQGNSALTLNGVTIAGSDFTSSSTNGSVIVGRQTATVAMVNSTISGSVTNVGWDLTNVALRESATLVMQGSTLSGATTLGSSAIVLGLFGVAGSPTVTLINSALLGNTVGILSTSSTTPIVTLTNSQINDSLICGISLEGGGTLTVNGSTFDGNWPQDFLTNSRGASAINLSSAALFNVSIRNSTFIDNGNTSNNNTSRAIRMQGSAASSFDLGTALDAGNNRLAGNPTFGAISVEVNPAVRVSAVGNVWNPNVQSANASGLYDAASPICSGAPPCDVTTGAGTNYQVTSGTLRLVE
jgi:hypothetical protein